MYHIKDTRHVPGELAVRAREYMKTLPLGWITVTQSCKAFTSGIGFLEDTAEARELGPTIAEILKWEYDFDKADYHAASNCITVRSRTDD
jgi:hypothetical protein